jgi:hypothetical protein
VRTLYRAMSHAVPESESDGFHNWLFGSCSLCHEIICFSRDKRVKKVSFEKKEMQSLERDSPTSGNIGVGGFQNETLSQGVLAPQNNYAR